MATTEQQSTAVPARVDDHVCWSTVAGLAVLHAGAIAGMAWIVLRPSTATLVLAMSLYAVCGLAITAGYHRLFAHRTYRASAIVRWLMLAFGAATFQNSAIAWSADHRAHHADTDGDGDPHAITRGIWFAHMGWLFHRRVASADVTTQRDLWAVRSIRLQHRWYPIYAIGIGLVLPTAIATSWGDPVGGLVVAGFLRTVVMLQMTFCINSLAHLVGSSRYDRKSSARDSSLAAFVTFGEGYHSFHHRFPADFRNGIQWYHWDPAKWFISTLRALHLATDLRAATPPQIEQSRMQAALRDIEPKLALARTERAATVRALIVDARSHLDSALTLWRQYVDERAQGATKAWRRTRKNAQTHLAEARRR